MGVSAVRPKVANLVFHLYGRSVHPELFESYAQQGVRRGPYRAEVRILDSGHVVSWQVGKACLTEVASAADQPLPQKRRILSHRLRGERTDSVEYADGVVYQVGFQLERLEPEVFLHVHEELLHDARRRGISYHFAPSSRLLPGPLSVLHVEACARSLLVQTFHTFPGDLAIVKTQSLFEVS